MARSSSQRPSFMSKVVSILDNSDGSCVGWASDGCSFIVHDVDSFASRVLTKYFKSANFASFVRQLNFYGFHKVLRDDKSEWEFRHEAFRRDRPDLIRTIKRKTASDFHYSKDELDSLRSEVTGLRAEVADLKEQLASVLNIAQKAIKMSTAAKQAPSSASTRKRVRRVPATESVTMSIASGSAYGAMEGDATVMQEAPVSVAPPVAPRSMSTSMSTSSSSSGPMAAKMEADELPDPVFAPWGMSTDMWGMAGDLVDPVLQSPSMEGLTSIAETTPAWDSIRSPPTDMFGDHSSGPSPTVPSDPTSLTLSSSGAPGWATSDVGLDASFFGTHMSEFDSPRPEVMAPDVGPDGVVVPMDPSSRSMDHLDVAVFSARSTSADSSPLVFPKGGVDTKIVRRVETMTSQARASLVVALISAVLQRFKAVASEQPVPVDSIWSHSSGSRPSPARASQAVESLLHSLPRGSNLDRDPCHILLSAMAVPAVQVILAAKFQKMAHAISSFSASSSAAPPTMLRVGSM